MGVLQAGDPVGHNRLVALKADLHMTQSGIGQHAKFFAGQQHRRCDEIGVQSDVAGVLDQFDQILARGRFTAGEMDLQHADFGQLGEDLLPLLGRKLAAATVELDGIGTIRALQRTTMRQFGQHRERNAECLRRRAALLQHREPVARIAGCYVGVGERWTHEVFLMMSSRGLGSETLIGKVLQHGDHVG